MPTTRNMEEVLGLVLGLGTVLSALLVLAGGILFLLQHGSQNMHVELIQPPAYFNSFKLILQAALSFAPLAIMQLGLLGLVATQLLRVGLLMLFYLFTRDYIYTFICAFILTVLFYSFISHK